MKRVIQQACKNCGQEVPRKPNVFCCQKCQIDYQYKKYIERWKAGKEKGYKGVACLISGHIRKYLFEKFDSECVNCRWNEVNPITKRVPLEVNHKDGNAKNCCEGNLELLCPNCHSLTSNFRNLNKGNSVRIRHGGSAATAQVL